MVRPTDARMIELIHLGRSFRRADGREVAAVSDVSLTIPEGEFVCLIGTSGCGKSTLLSMIAGLLAPTAGSVVVDGREVDGPGPERGMVFQKDSVFPWMRVVENVEYGLRCRGVPPAERRAVARSYLERVGLAHVESAWPRELSGGMLKRVAIATVFANGGKVLMLDEPFGALDYVTRHQLHDVLLGLWDDGGAGAARRTVLFVTHDVDEALLLADRILVVKSGRIADDIRVEATRPRDTDTLLRPDIVGAKHRLLGHLGLERRAPRPLAEGAAA